MRASSPAAEVRNLESALLAWRAAARDVGFCAALPNVPVLRFTVSDGYMPNDQVFIRYESNVYNVILPDEIPADRVVEIERHTCLPEVHPDPDMKFRPLHLFKSLSLYALINYS